MNWQLDPAHSNVTISAKHMMVTTVRGTLAVKHADLDFDTEHPERGSVSVVLDAASIDSGVEGRDAHLRSPDFLDVERYPEIAFRSTHVEPVRGDRYRIHGDLTIRGTTRQAVLDARLVGVMPDWRSDGRRAAFHATASIDREAWGLTWNVALEAGGWLVSRELKVEIDLAAVQAAEASAHAA